MNIQCLRCKGRGFCGRTFCPIIAKSKARAPVKDILKEDFASRSPSPFIGREGYPYINVGFLAPPEKKEDIDRYDAPREWAEKELEIKNIIDMRSSLINSRVKSGILESNRIVDMAKEIALSQKAPDVEVNLKKKPQYALNLDPQITPMGPRAEIKKAEITENTKIPRKVEEAVDEDDYKANDAIRDLNKRGLDENYLSKVLSVGTIGRKKDRKLVPTRWSITAVDDNLGKDKIQRIKDHQHAEHTAYFGGYLGNYYLILIFPEQWSYELFEAYLPRSSWNTSEEIQFMTDYEPFGGRKSYAENCAGGYYAARLPILETLEDIKRQASVLALRFITGEYSAPLGVWVCREAARKSLDSRPIEFADRELMLKYARSMVKKKFGYDLDHILDESIILRNLKSQSKLTDF